MPDFYLGGKLCGFYSVLIDIEAIEYLTFGRITLQYCKSRYLRFFKGVLTFYRDTPGYEQVGTKYVQFLKSSAGVPTRTVQFKLDLTSKFVRCWVCLVAGQIGMLLYGHQTSPGAKVRVGSGQEEPFLVLNPL